MNTTTNAISYREDVTPAQADERRRALAALVRAAGRAVDQGGSNPSVDDLHEALLSVQMAYDLPGSASRQRL